MGGRVLLHLLIVLAITVVCHAKVKPVRVSLDAKWSSSPLLLEASEFMAEEGLFTNFVDKLKDQSILNDLENTEAWYYHTIKVANQLLSPSRVKLLEFALSMRLFSSKVQLHQQAARELEADCLAYAVVGDKVICDSAAVKAAVTSAPAFATTLYSGDHLRCLQHCSKDRGHPVVVYGELGSRALNEFLNADLGAYSVLRHYVKVEGDRKVRLSGYGVELAIKSTEYKAQDDSKQAEDTDHEPLEGEVSGFNFTRLGVKYPELKKELQAYKNALSETSNELKPLKVWQMQDLSYQAAQKAVDSGDAPLAQLEVLKDISQNFPSLTSSLVKVQMRDSFRKSVKKAQKALDQYGVGVGDSALLVNGITMDIDTVDMFSLYDVIRGDLTVMDQLSTHGLGNEDIGNILKHMTNSKDQQFALDIRDSAIMYINDLERDEIYSQWPRTLRALLQPTFPGMMRHLSRNLFNLVMIFDVMDVKSGTPLELLASLYSHQAPIRIGFVPVAKEGDEVGMLLSQIFFKLVDEKDGPEAVLALAEFYQKMTSSETSVISVEDVAGEFKKVVGDLDEIREDEDYINSREKAYHFYERSGLAEMPAYLLNGVPLEGLTADNMDEVVVGEVLKSTPTFQRAVYHGKLTDDMDPLEWLMMQEHVMPRLNARVLNADNKCVSVDTDSGVALGSLKYLYKGAEDVMRDTTMLVVGDLGSVSGRQLLLEAITHMKTTKKVRVGIIHNQVEESMYSKAVQLAMERLEADEARAFITKLLKLTKDTLDISDIESLAVPGMNAKEFADTLAGYKFDFASHGAFSRSKLMLACGQRAVISNGRMVGPLENSEQFTTDDFALLERYGGAGDTVVRVSKVVKKMGLEPAKASDVMSLVLGTLACTTSEKSRKDIKLDDGGESMITIAADTSEPAFDIVAIIEPLSRGAQKILPILLTLQKVVNCEVKVYLNCKDKLSELPLKSYYRYVLDPEIHFNVVGGLASGPEAYFDSLPHKSILTLNVQPPEGWLVESVSALHDLDNIKLEQVKTGVDAGYELEYLLLEGHCYESDTGQPPRGLQLLLGRDNSSDSATADTLVMANLGYFQLKANPGAWHLMIRPGRSADFYSITSHEHTDSPSKSEDVVVVMDTFKSKIINMKVTKRPGKEGEDLLSDKGEDEGEEQGLWGSISSSLGGGSTADEDKDEYLNIFSLASGHLYERLMRIMILSIVKQTKSPVKFWLLKNYLSPEFKDFIPVMAKEYGFKYELVQYKWPRWLNQQTEKQRVMWGYKILFLDVLFPLGVKKIAFIDADQIVRTDIQELFDLDLEGAPYGYTPFCDSRKEMDGFRFWKSGYWASHLGRRPYHISALYVIDLKRFRKIAAGDRLRGQYQALSQDPNSLSNLDQDLPNNMIHQVKIKSLPQEWLWCETWCSDESKAKAKTIDLCNNPRTKEPKLDAARRIVPEWIDYDNEIKTLWDSWQASRPVKETADDSEPTKASHSHIEL